jgi:putative membrane protein
VIVKRELDWKRLARSVGPLLGVLLAYDIVVTVLYVGFGWKRIGINDLPLPLLGSALALVVTLRNNAAYARWWEARGLWGSILNNSRNLARGTLLLLPASPLRDGVVRRQVGYGLALRQHLLRQAPWDDLAPYVPAAELARLRTVGNVPVGIQANIARSLATAGLDTISLSTLDRTLSAVTDAQGGLERIRNTPLPMHYRQFPLVFSRIYCLLLPLGLVGDMGLFTPLGSTVIGFMFLALDRIGQDLQDPFEGDIHDVPMMAITRTIEIDLLQMIEATDVPAPVTPKDGVLP